MHRLYSSKSNISFPSRMFPCVFTRPPDVLDGQRNTSYCAYVAFHEHLSLGRGSRASSWCKLLRGISRCKNILGGRSSWKLDALNSLGSSPLSTDRQLSFRRFMHKIARHRASPTKDHASENKPRLTVLVSPERVPSNGIPPLDVVNLPSSRGPTPWA